MELIFLMGLYVIRVFWVRVIVKLVLNEIRKWSESRSSLEILLTTSLEWRELENTRSIILPFIWDGKLTCCDRDNECVKLVNIICGFEVALKW